MSLKLGELWVTYKIKLTRASLRNTQQSIATNGCRLRFDSGIESAPAAGDGPLFGSGLAYAAGESLKVTAQQGSSALKVKFEWPENVIAGDYLVVLNTVGELPTRMLGYANLAGTSILDSTGNGDALLEATPATAEGYFLAASTATSTARWNVCSFTIRLLAPNAQRGAFEVEWSDGGNATAHRTYATISQISDAISGDWSVPV